MTTSITSPKRPPSYCSNCGTEVTNAGRAGRDGKRYCTEKACQAAKARARRRQIAALTPEREVPTKCSCCQRKLPAREWRSGDELGRWCTRARCRRHRQETWTSAGVADLPTLQNRVMILEDTVAFLSEVVMADAEDYHLSNRRVCRVCGLTSAVPGWVHPTAANTGCGGTLDGAAVRRFDFGLGVAGAWPFRRQYLTPEELDAAYGEDRA